MTSPTETQIQQAISAARAGDKRTAQDLLHRVVHAEPQNARAWYLLSQVAETQAQAIDCLERVLRIEPGNAQALQQLEKLKAGHTHQPPARPKPRKKTGSWLWLGLGGLIGVFAILSLWILAAGLAGITANPDQAAVLPPTTRAQSQPATLVLPATWTPTFTAPPSATSTPLPPTETLPPTPPSLTPISSVQPAAAGSTLRVHFIDVGQGDATLIQTADGQNVLIDGGETDSGILLYLQSIGVRRIDLMIATHPDSDHIGGLLQVLKAMPVAKVVTNGELHTTSDYQQFLYGIADAGAEYSQVKRGDAITLGNLSFQVLNPAGNLSDNLNENSLVLRFNSGNTSFLMMGDANTRAEADMLAVGLPLKTDILKLGRHGSKTASSQAFLKAVRPAVAVYFAGDLNGSALPDGQVIAALAAIGAQVYGTDQHGTIIVSVDPAGYTIDSAKQVAQAPPGAIPPTSALTPTATLPPLPVSGGFRVVSLTSPIRPGETASLTIRTAPGARCTITVYIKSEPITAAGLEQKTADANGMLTWSWKVGNKTKPGDWYIVVTAKVYGKTYTRDIPFVVK